jgi:hypothetical protein
VFKKLFRFRAWLLGYKRDTTQVNVRSRLFKVPFTNIIIDYGNDKFYLPDDKVASEEEVVLMLEDFDLEDGPDYEFYSLPTAKLPKKESAWWGSSVRSKLSVREINEHVNNNDPDFVIEKLK